MVSRILLSCLLLASLAGLGCDEAARRAREEHVLNRIGYGPDPWSRERIRTLGIDAYIEEQLYPERIDDSANESRVRGYYPLLGLSLAQLRARYDGGTPETSNKLPRRHLASAKLLRAVRSKRQLEQVLVDFWFNHFNVDARKEIAVWDIPPYERDAIRPYVLGRFEDMLRAVARAPSMLEYLDNAQNFREGFVRGRKSYGVNENFARELLEVHTVGPRAGQTLADIRGVALAFTGWTVADDLIGSGGGFTFLADGHDRSAKRILGLSIPSGGGISDGNAVIRHLARHPDTAVHIATKLCRRFVAERATGCEVAAAARFLSSGGDLRAVMREILRSEAFHDPRYFRTKVKSPLHTVASTARALGLSDSARFATTGVREVANMGEDLFAIAPPIGRPDVSQAWLGESSFVRRFNLGFLGSAGAIGFRAPAPLARTDVVSVSDTVTDRLLLGGTGSVTRGELFRLLQRAPLSWRVSEATALLLSSPEFAHH
jgi:hypothetical protein